MTRKLGKDLLGIQICPLTKCLPQHSRGVTNLKQYELKLYRFTGVKGSYLLGNRMPYGIHTTTHPRVNVIQGQILAESNLSFSLYTKILCPN
jgi:hypothetical protein